jgi:hypothetical protein
MPACEAKTVAVVTGGPYSSGVLAGGSHFKYAPAPPEILAKVNGIRGNGPGNMIYRLIKEIWRFPENRVAVRFAYVAAGKYQ